MANIRRARYGFSVVGTTADFGFTVGAGQYVDLDAVPDAVRPHMPPDAFEEEPPTEDDAHPELPSGSEQGNEPATRRRRR